VSGVALDRLIRSDERCPFLSEQLERSEDLSSKPFGFGLGRSKQLLSAFCCLSNEASPLQFHLPVPVKMPVSFLTMNGFYTRIFACQGESTLRFGLYLSGFCGNPVDIECGKNVENTASFIRPQFTIFIGVSSLTERAIMSTKSPKKYFFAKEICVFVFTH
jgi:hypothetical protein